jgi:serine O-acetyltransferase
LFHGIKEELNSIRERDPAARTNLEVFFLYPGYQAVFWHKLTRRLYKKRWFFLARLLSQLVAFFTRIEIHPGATIGKGLFIDHGAGVVIGETTEIGDWCTIYQGVTLGGTGKEKGKRHPTLGDHVMVGSGAKILGPFKVGDYARIAANAVVLDQVPPYGTAVGVPARVVRLDGKPIPCETLDHVNMPDPMALEICRLQERIGALEALVADRLPPDCSPQKENEDKQNLSNTQKYDGGH